uniref:ATP synthase mitochondrial F1 complex assembly factor 2 n=1 Tax=Panagrellus redivivus TaxID=6233 RepID=A0A7E4UXR8_PANRE
MVDSEPLALAIATEWDAQKEHINKTHMRLTGLAFTALDNPFHETKETLTDKIMEFLDTDTLLYFADEQESLVDLQKEKWAPVIKGVNDNHGIDIRATQSIMDTPQISDEDRLRIQRWLLSHNFWALHGLQYGVEAAKSMMAMMALNSHQITVEEAAEAARLEQIYQTKIWGNVEWSHDIEHQELCTRLSAAVLFTYFNSNHAIVKKHEASA